MKSSDIDQDLFTDTYCKVCSAQLISESQRVAHYEVRTALHTRSVQVEEGTARIMVVGLENTCFWIWESFQNHRTWACTAWGQSRVNTFLWGRESGLETSFWGPGCFSVSFLLMYTSSPRHSVGFLYLLYLSLLMLKSPFRDTWQVNYFQLLFLFMTLKIGSMVLVND
jgi:hypothetical protein